MELIYPGERRRFLIAAVFSGVVWLGLAALLRWMLPALLLGFMLVYLFAQSAFIAYLRGTAVRVGALQMQELNQHLLAACRRLKIEHPPELYLLHSEGVFNAMAARFLGRNYIVLFSSVVEALEPLPAGLDFYIGHELGHIRRGHSFWKPLLMPAEILPLLGPALSRAWEYSCDRHGLAACENPAYAKIALAAMAAGRGQWKKLNLNAYQEQVKETRGFWMSYHELVGDYPWLVKRMAALNALADKQEPEFPSRNPLAFVLAFFTPRLSMGTGAGGALVSVAMIGVLAAIAIPAYQDFAQRAAVARAYQEARPLRQAIESYSSSQLRLPSAAQIGAETKQVTQGEIRIRMEPQDGGRIEISFAGGGLADSTLLLFPEALKGDPRSLEWHCTGDLAPKLRPQGCEWSDEAPEDPAESAPAAETSSAPATVPQGAAVAHGGGDPVAMAIFDRMTLVNAKKDADRIAVLVEQYQQAHKAWPKSVDELSVAARAELDRQGLVSASYALGRAGEITVTLEGGSYSGGGIVLKPRVKGYEYSWSCAASGIPAEILPEGCR